MVKEVFCIEYKNVNCTIDQFSDISSSLHYLHELFLEINFIPKEYSSLTIENIILSSDGVYLELNCFQKYTNLLKTLFSSVLKKEIGKIFQSEKTLTAIQKIYKPLNTDKSTMSISIKQVIQGK